jgi:hypothetical protein
MSTSPLIIHVTEHALLRYCERVLGADRNWIMKRVRDSLPTNPDGTLRDGRHTIEAGKFEVIVEDNCVLTVLHPAEVFSKKHRANRLHRRYRHPA